MVTINFHPVTGIARRAPHTLGSGHETGNRGDTRLTRAEIARLIAAEPALSRPLQPVNPIYK